MMSIETIRRMSRQAARQSAREGKVPLLVEAEDMAEGVLESHLRHIPFIGDRNPRGYRPLRDADGSFTEHFCDSSGRGVPGEAAETFDEFCRHVRERGPGFAYAVTEAGQWQAYIRVYRYAGGRA